MFFLRRILLTTLLKGVVVISERADREVVSEWLYLSYKNKGFAHYNTLRKKMIHELMSLGIEDKEYWIAVGRLRELQSLGMNIKDEFSRRDKKQNKVIEKS